MLHKQLFYEWNEYTDFQDMVAENMGFNLLIRRYLIY